jgi:DNA-binding NarL/FixJ family response regulator
LSILVVGGVIVDKRRLIAEALAALISARDGFSVTATVVGNAAVAEISAQHPDVAIIGLSAEPQETLSLVRELRAHAPDVEVVIVADALEPELIGFVLDHGISGLLLTDSAGREVATCLDQVAHGRAVLPNGWQGALVADRNEPLGSLSERQMQVLVLLAEGLSYEEIGTRLFISLNTVKFHVRSIFLRLGVRNRMAAARMLSRRKGAAERFSDRMSSDPSPSATVD